MCAATWTALCGCMGLLCDSMGRLCAAAWTVLYGCIGHQFCAAAWTVFIVRLHGPSHYYYYAAAWTVFIARLHGPSLLYYYAAAWTVFCGNAWLPLGAQAPPLHSVQYYNNHKTKSCCVLAAPTLASKRPRLWLTTWLNGYRSPLSLFFCLFHARFLSQNCGVSSRFTCMAC